MHALYLLFLPPLLLSGSPDDRCRCPCDRLRRRRSYPSYRRASRQAEPLPLSHISPTVLYFSVALAICCCYDSVLFQLHSLSLSPLVYLPISHAAYINILYSSGPCALLVIG